jgi:hypothetical protein
MAFRRLLNQLDEETLGLYGWKYVNAIDMRLRIDEDDLNLAYFIAENYGDIECPTNDNEDYMLYSLEKYLFRLPFEDLRDLYHDYVSPENVIEDLMELEQTERLVLIAHFYKTDMIELEHLDTVYLN